jgi:predicted transposase YdaD
MAKAADIGSKRLISLDPGNWVKWLMNDDHVQQVEVIGSEFQWVTRTNDALIKVHSEQHGVYLIANEIQFRPDRRMALRMRAYAALAEERYNLPVLPVVVNVLRGQPIPERYYREFMGLVAQQDYRVIKLWEVDASLVFDQHLSALLPFVPVLRGGQKLPIITKAAQALRQDENLRELEPLLALLASFVLDTDTVHKIMRWNMVELRESPWYNEIVEEGFQKGLEQGLEQGRVEGIPQGQLRMVLRLFEHRFGEPDSALAHRIDKLDSEQLDRMMDVLLDATERDAVIAFVEQSAAQ